MNGAARDGSTTRHLNSARRMLTRVVLAPGRPPRRLACDALAAMAWDALGTIAAASLGVHRASWLHQLHTELRAERHRKGGAEREVAPAQGRGSEAHLRGYQTSIRPKVTAELLTACTMHVCESRDSMEV